MRHRRRTIQSFAGVLLCGLALTLAEPTETFAQTPHETISVSFKDKDLSSILDFIARQSGYRIDYEPEVKTGGYKATVSFDEVST